MNRLAKEPTHWTLIARAQGSGPQARNALGELVRQYEPYVLWLVRHFRCPPDKNPEDLKQEFLTRVVKNNDIGKLNRERGTFRAWLKMAVRNFMRNEWKAWHTIRAGRKCTSLTPFESFHDVNILDDLCTRGFAVQVVTNALARQRDEVRDKERFDRLVRFLPGPQLDIVELTPTASELGMTRTALAKHICLMRARYRELLRVVVRDTLDFEPPSGDSERRTSRPDITTDAVDAELRDLYRCFQTPEQTTVLLRPNGAA